MIARRRMMSSLRGPSKRVSQHETLLDTGASARYWRNIASITTSALSSKKLQTLLLTRGEGLSRAAPKGRLSQTLDRPSPRQHNGNGNEAKRSSGELRSLAGFFLRPLTKTRLLNPRWNC